LFDVGAHLHDVGNRVACRPRPVNLFAFAFDDPQVENKERVVDSVHSRLLGAQGGALNVVVTNT
jgi:hypothetical protein